MADQEKELDLEADAGTGKLNNKKIIIIIAIVVLLLGGGAAAFFLMKKAPASKTTETSEEAHAADAHQEEKQPAIYFPMKQNFVLSYRQDKKTRYLQAELCFMFRDEKLLDILQEHTPTFRNRFIDVFSIQDPTELETPDAKENLRIALLAAAHTVLEEENVEATIEQILFLALVMQ